MKNKKILILLIPAALIVLGAYYFYRQRTQENPHHLKVSGNIEVTEVDLSFRIPGWVEARLVSEGQTVQAGQEVARLDQRELAQEVELRGAEVKIAEAALAELQAGSRPEEIAQAKAAYQKAQAGLDELLAGSRVQEIAAAKAEVQAVQVETERLKTDLARVGRLHESGALTDQEYERAQAAYNVAYEKHRAAQEHLKLLEAGPRPEQIAQGRAQLEQAQAALALVEKGPRTETIAGAQARLQQSREMLAISQTHLSYGTLSSPIKGVVLSQNVESGEFVAAGTPIVTVADLGQVWLRAYIEETDLGRIKLGQQVKVRTDTFVDKIYEGRISFIASEAEFTPKNVQTQKERVKLVYRIKIDISNSNQELKPGMPADAEIVLDK